MSLFVTNISLMMHRNQLLSLREFRRPDLEKYGAGELTGLIMNMWFLIIAIVFADDLFAMRLRRIENEQEKKTVYRISALKSLAVGETSFSKTNRKEKKITQGVSLARNVIKNTCHVMGGLPIVGGGGGGKPPPKRCPIHASMGRRIIWCFVPLELPVLAKLLEGKPD